MSEKHTIFKDAQVLLVDDSEHTRELLKQCLRGLSFQSIQEAGSVDEASQFVEKKNVDLVLVDQLLGEGLGTDLVRHIRMSSESRNPYVPIIMITGFADKMRLDMAVKAGVNYVVAKPIRPKDVYDRIWKCIYTPHEFLKTDCYCGPDHPYLYRVGAVCEPLEGRCDDCPIYKGVRPDEAPHQEDDAALMV